MVLTLKGLLADMADVLPLIAMRQLMLGNGAGIAENLEGKKEDVHIVERIYSVSCISVTSTLKTTSFQGLAMPLGPSRALHSTKP